MWVNSWFLALLPLAALPVIIHMIHRQKYRILDFSTLIFFDRSHKYNVFRMELRHILLMCLRILAVLLFILAFARLSLDHLGLGDQQQAVVLVMDGSTSVTQRFGEGTLFEFAVQQAVQSAGELHPGALVGVVSNTSPPRLVLPPSSDREAVRNALANLRPFYREGTSWAAVQLAQKTLESVRASSRWVVVFTDLQRTAWLPRRESRKPPSPSPDAGHPREDHSAGPARGDASRSSSDIPVRFMALRPVSRHNCAIVRVEAQEQPVIAGRVARFAATLQNFSDRPAEGIHAFAGLGPNAGGKAPPAETLEVAIPPGGQMKVPFFLTFSTAGPQEAWFLLGDDALAADNRGVEAVSVLGALPVLCLGDPGEGGKQEVSSDLFYLSNALAPLGKAGHLSLAVIPFDQLSKTGLYGINCVFLASVKDLGVKEVQLIRQYVGRGGGLVIFPGIGTDTASLRLLLGDGESEPLMPVAIGDSLHTPTQIASADFLLPAIGREADRLDRQFVGVSYNSRYDLSMRPDTAAAAKILAVFDDGKPAVLQARFGFGRAILFAGGCSPASSDLPYRPVFPALVQELANQLALPVRTTMAKLSPGEFFAAAFEEADRPNKLHIVHPDGMSRPIPIRPGKLGYSLSFQDTFASGFYQLQARYRENDPDTVLEAFAVNIGGADSDLTPASREELLEQTAASPVFVEIVDKPILQRGLLGTDRREVMRLLLGLVLLLILAENLLSWVTR